MGGLYFTWLDSLIQFTSVQHAWKRISEIRRWRTEKGPPFLLFPLSLFFSITPHFVSVCLERAEGTCCYICILMTPPVAPKAGPSALPRDQLGPGPIVCCAPFKNPYQLTLLLSLPSFSPTRALPLHPIVTVSANLKHWIFHTFFYLNLYSTTIFNFNIVWWVLKLHHFFLTWFCNVCSYISYELCDKTVVQHSWHLEEEKGTEENVTVWCIVHKNINKPGWNYGTVKHLAQHNNNITLYFGRMVPKHLMISFKTSS